MFDLDDEASQREKCYTTVTQLPAFVDPKQLPTKKPPFSVIQEHPFVHTVPFPLFHFVLSLRVSQGLSTDEGQTGRSNPTRGGPFAYRGFIRCEIAKPSVC